MDTGTIKSIERQRGTGSIAPDRESEMNFDTGFTTQVVGENAFAVLRVGERVHLEAVEDPARPGYANAIWVESIEPDHAERAASQSPTG